MTLAHFPLQPRLKAQRPAVKPESSYREAMIFGKVEPGLPERENR